MLKEKAILSYKEKYINKYYKYKHKYLKLKKQIGSAGHSEGNLDDEIVLESVDGYQFKVRFAIVMLSETIKALASFPVDEAEIEQFDVPLSALPLPSVKGSILKKIIDYCTYHYMNIHRSKDEKNQWNMEFMNENINDIISLFNAAFYLDIKDLISLTFFSIINIINGDKNISVNINDISNFLNEYESYISTLSLDNKLKSFKNIIFFLQFNNNITYLSNKIKGLKDEEKQEIIYEIRNQLDIIRNFIDLSLKSLFQLVPKPIKYNKFKIIIYILDFYNLIDTNIKILLDTRMKKYINNYVNERNKIVESNAFGDLHKIKLKEQFINILPNIHNNLIDYIIINQEHVQFSLKCIDIEEYEFDIPIQIILISNTIKALSNYPDDEDDEEIKKWLDEWSSSKPLFVPINNYNVNKILSLLNIFIKDKNEFRKAIKFLNYNLDLITNIKWLDTPVDFYGPIIIDYINKVLFVASQNNDNLKKNEKFREIINDEIRELLEQIPIQFKFGILFKLFKFAEDKNDLIENDLKYFYNELLTENLGFRYRDIAEVLNNSINQNKNKIEKHFTFDELISILNYEELPESLYNYFITRVYYMFININRERYMTWTEAENEKPGIMDEFSREYGAPPENPPPFPPNQEEINKFNNLLLLLPDKIISR